MGEVKAKPIVGEKAVRFRNFRPVPNRPFLSCQHCDGSGLIPLDDKQWECLQIMQKLKNATVEAVHILRKPGDGQTNANNILEDLRQLGFVTRSEKRFWRKWIYTVV